MAFLQQDKKSGRFRIRFDFGGQEFKRSVKTQKENIARSIQGRVEDTIRMLEQGRLTIPPGVEPGVFILSDGKLTAKPVAVRPLTLAELVEKYQQSSAAAVKETTTKGTERTHCKHLVQIMGGATALQTMTPADVQSYIDARSQQHWHGKAIKGQTVRKEVDTFKTIWNWAASMGYLTGAPPIKGAKTAKSKDREPFRTWDEIERITARKGLSPEERAELWETLFLNRQEVAELLAHVRSVKARPYVHPLFVFIAHTGARRSEALRCRIDDFDFPNRTVVIREKKRDRTKSITFRRVDMTPVLVDVMTSWFAQHPGGQFAFCFRPDRPLTEQTATKTLRRVLKRSKWKLVRGFHVFRHSFASNSAAAGIDQRIIDEWMGHKTEAMRKRYRHLFQDQRRRAIEAVYPV